MKKERNIIFEKETWIILWEENKLICVLSIISLLIALSYIITYNLPELIPGINSWYSLGYDISLGIMVNFVFFMFQLFIPSQRKRRQAFTAIKPTLESLYFVLSDILLCTDWYIKIDNDNISVSNGIHYFIRHNVDSDNGWLTKMDLSTQGIEDYYAHIETVLSKITNNFTYSNNSYELIKNISDLQSNQYLNYLKYAVSETNPNVRYDNAEHEYNQFKEIITYFGKCVNKSCLEVSIPTFQDVLAHEAFFTTSIASNHTGIARRWVKIPNK